MLPRFFRILPTTLRNRIKGKFSIPSMEISLLNLRANGFRPKKIVDIGAYEGSWTQMIKEIFPEAEVLMIEAQKRKNDCLQKVASKYEGKVSLFLTLLGPYEASSASYYENETVTSVLPEYYPTAAKLASAPMTTLDEVMRKKGWQKVDLIKLDVQGYELEILKAGVQTLSQAETVLMEVSLIEINKGAPLLHEVVQFMSENGFRAYDICSLIRRPLDHALWQVDMLFIKDDSPLVQSKHWS